MQSDNSTHYARRINRVIDYINTHLDDELSVDRLSQVANFSRFHFHRQFTAYTGITVARLVLLMRLKRASFQLVFNPLASITDIAFDAGFASAESFSRAFKNELGQTPSAFRRDPQWLQWQVKAIVNLPVEHTDMQVDLIEFPQTLIAALEHHGPEHLSYNTTRKFIEWRQANRIGPGQGNTYGIHYSDPARTLPEDYRLDIGVSVEEPVAPNPQGVVNKTIPGGRCARARHLGSRHNISTADWLYREWLPVSGEQLRDFPIFFHYVNVGPDVKEQDMITDVYLPLR